MKKILLNNFINIKLLKRLNFNSSYICQTHYNGPIILSTQS